MSKIKNDPATYLRRSHLTLREQLKETTIRGRGQAPECQKDFLTAPVDEGFYIDFNPSLPMRPGYKNKKD